MKKSIQDLKESLRKKEEKQQRLHEQEETVKKDIRVLRYLIAKEEEAASPQAPGNEKSPKADKRLFTRISMFYEDLQRRLNLRITYRCFCRWLCTRYELESRYPDRHKLSPCTILGYFKRERGG